MPSSTAVLTSQFGASAKSASPIQQYLENNKIGYRVNQDGPIPVYTIYLGCRIEQYSYAGTSASKILSIIDRINKIQSHTQPPTFKVCFKLTATKTDTIESPSFPILTTLILPELTSLSFQSKLEIAAFTDLCRALRESKELQDLTLSLPDGPLQSTLIAKTFVANLKQCQSLTSIQLHNCSLTDRSIAPIIDALSELPHLRQVSFDNNPDLTISTAKAIAQKLESGELETLSLANVKFQSGVKEIFDALHKNKTLKRLNLLGSSVDNELLQIYEKAITQRGQPLTLLVTNNFIVYNDCLYLSLDHLDLDESLRKLKCIKSRDLFSRLKDNLQGRQLFSSIDLTDQLLSPSMLDSLISILEETPRVTKLVLNGAKIWQPEPQRRDLTAEEYIREKLAQGTRQNVTVELNNVDVIFYPPKADDIESYVLVEEAEEKEATDDELNGTTSYVLVDPNCCTPCQGPTPPPH